MVKKAAHATPNRRLTAARKERGWTQQQVADRIGAPLALNISRWENGTAFPSAYYIERLCQLFGKSVRELGLSQLEGETLNAVFPEVRHQVWGQWEHCGRLLPHVLTVVAAVTARQPSLELASLLTKTADYLLQRAQYEQAEPLYQRALCIREQTLGCEHPQVAYPLNGLANLYREQGRYEQAEPLYQRVLTIRYQQRGARHPETAESLHDFAHLHELRNQPEEALTLYQQALAIREQRLGPGHPHTLDTRTRYAHLLRACGRSEEAAALEAVSNQQATMSFQEPLRL